MGTLLSEWCVAAFILQEFVNCVFFNLRNLSYLICAKTALVERIGNAPAKEILCPSREMNSGCAAVLDRLEDFWFSSRGSKQGTLPAASIHFGFCTSF